MQAAALPPVLTRLEGQPILEEFHRCMGNSAQGLGASLHAELAATTAGAEVRYRAMIYIHIYLVCIDI